MDILGTDIVLVAFNRYQVYRYFDIDTRESFANRMLTTNLVSACLPLEYRVRALLAYVQTFLTSPPYGSFVFDPCNVVGLIND